MRTLSKENDGNFKTIDGNLDESKADQTELMKVELSKLDKTGICKTGEKFKLWEFLCERWLVGCHSAPTPWLRKSNSGLQQVLHKDHKRYESRIQNKIVVFRKPAITGKTSQAIAPLHFYDKFYCPETFKNVWKFLGCLEILQAVQKLSSLCRNFPDCLKTSQTVRKLGNCH